MNMEQASGREAEYSVLGLPTSQDLGWRMHSCLSRSITDEVHTFVLIWPHTVIIDEQQILLQLLYHSFVIPAVIEGR